jgi:preprotein translocase subunit SecD
MLYFSRAKTLAILGICVFAALLCIPNAARAPAAWMPWRTVHLGLDLQGGSYLLMQVDMNSVVKERLASLTDAARDQLRKAGIFYKAVAAQSDGRRVIVQVRDPARTEAAAAALKPLVQTQGAMNTPDLDITTNPNGTVTLQLSPVALHERALAAVQQSIEIVRRRIDETGVLDPQVSREGEDRIVVQLPGVGDPERIKALLGETAHMTFQLVDPSVTSTTGTPPPGVEFLPTQDDPNRRIAVRTRVDVDGADLTDARAATDQQSGEWVVNFTFNAVGARRFGDITRANVGRPFAIVLDGKVISSPVIREPITGGRGQISGSFNAQTASDLALLLRAGALPAPLTVIQESTIGPELGADAIRAGAISLAIGFVLVIVFMGFFYGLFGWFANLTLVVNLVLMLAILSLLQATLTLPGMAGVLLTLGMAVDANILINERIREEQKLGRPPLAALEHGFSHAYRTIFDSNATTFLAHVMLFIFGSGPVRGFAVTITVGIATSLFTAWLLTRLLVSRWYVAHRPRLLPV